MAPIMGVTWPKAWVEEGKKDPKFFQHPGFVSFEFLINMWKIPKDDLYKMLSMEVDSIYPPIPVYKGYGVIRILKKRPAEFFNKIDTSNYKATFWFHFFLYIRTTIFR